jgi:hypothetical protein
LEEEECKKHHNYANLTISYHLGMPKLGLTNHGFLPSSILTM